MPKPSSDQNKGGGPIVMDSRKFLGAINSSAQAKVALMESVVHDLGKRSGATWRLLSLNDNKLLIEDVGTRSYLSATANKGPNNRIDVSNIRPVRVVEGKKRSVFENSCLQLVNAIEENNQSGMLAAYKKMAGQRFTARSIPESGRVQTRDGVSRSVYVASDALIGEEIRPRLVAALVEGLSDQVQMEGGRVVGGSFAGKIELPVSEWMSRKSIARYMRRAAEDAYLSPGFQNRVYHVASLINDDKIDEAVKVVSKFLAEQQEFTMLNRKQMQLLIENTLATKACFNQRLCTDTATLFWRTNLKVNRGDIIKEWRETAKRAGHSVLLENVLILEKSQNFEAAYNKFVDLVFNEAVGPRDIQVDAYKTALKALRDTPKIKDSNDLSGKLDELVDRLNQPETDHAVIAEVEDLLAEVKDELNAGSTLDDFDQMPGDENEPDEVSLGEEEPAAEGGRTTNVTFNVNINGDGVDVDSGEEEGGEDLEELLGGEEGGEEEGLEEEGGEEEGGGELEELLAGESRDADGDPIIEDGDPYAFSGDVKPISQMGTDYGTKPIEISEDCMRAVSHMIKLAEQNNLQGKAIVERVEELAQAGIKAAGLKIPQRRQDSAVEQVCEAFFDELDRRGIPLDENQYKAPWRHVWGRKKAAITRREGYGGKGANESIERGQTVEECDEPMPPRRRRRRRPTQKESAIKWVEHQDDGSKGIFEGVGFIFDHGGNNNQLEPVVLSEDGQVEVPVPEDICASAFAAAELDQGDPTLFLEWLSNNIEQFRPIGTDENQSLDEAIATITANPDGSMSVEVDSEEVYDDAAAMDADAGPGMQPVEAMPPTPDMGPGIEGDDSMPDFEGGPPMDEIEDEVEGDEEEGGGPPPEFTEGGGDEDEEEGDEEEDEEDEEGVAEDRDVTTPQAGKYNTAKDNHRKQPNVPKVGKGGDELDGFGTGDGATPGAKMKKVHPRK